MLEKAKGVITKKIGPLPVWAYVVVGAGLVFLLRKRGGGGGSANDQEFVAAGPAISRGDGGIASGGNAVGSPGQNQQGGSDTQPGGDKPWWASDGLIHLDPRESLPVSRGGFVPDDLWGVIDGGNKIGPSTPAGSNPGGATAGPAPISLPPLTVLLKPGPTAGELAKEPAGGWTTPPAFQQIAPDKVLVPGGGTVNPGNHLIGYSNPVTGEFRQTPFLGGVPMWS